MKTTSEITIEIAADLARLRTDMNQANGIVSKTMNGISSAGSAAINVLSGLGVALSASAMVGYVRTAIDAADATSKLAQSVGLSTEQVAGLQLAYGQSGLEQTRMVESLAKLTQAAVTGNDAFTALGISVRNSDGSFRTSRELLADVADRFQNLEDGTVKTGLAMKLFGETGGQLIPLLNGGSQSLEYFDDAATRLGLTISEKTAKEAEKFNDTLDLMMQGAKGVGLQIAADLLPTLNQLAEDIPRVTREFSPYLAGGAVTLGLVAMPSAITAISTVILTKLVPALVLAGPKLLLLASAAAAIGFVYSRMDADGSKLRNSTDALNKLFETEAELLKQIEERGEDATNSFLGMSTGGKTLGQQLSDVRANINNYAGSIFELTGATNTVAASSNKAGAGVMKLGGLFDETGKKAKKMAEDMTISKYMDRELDAAIKESEGLWKEYYDGLKKAQDELTAGGKQVFQETRTPLEQYITRIEYLQKLFDGKVIDVETFTRGVEKANKDLEDFGKTGRSEIEELEFAIQGFGRKSADAFVDFALTGKASFKDLTDSILADLARLIVQQNITDPIFKAISGGVSEGGGLGGILGSLAGSISGFFDSGPVEFGPTPFAKGGIMTPYGPMKLNAYAGGGIVSSPQMYVAGEGSMNEAIIPLPDGRSVPVTMTGGGTGEVNVEVNVINQGQPANARVVGQRQTAGGFSIDVLIDTVDNALGQRMTKGQGSLANAVPRKFGLNGAAGNAR